MSWELILLVAVVMAIAGVKALGTLVASEYDLRMRVRRAQNTFRRRMEIKRRERERYAALLHGSDVEQSPPSE